MVDFNEEDRIDEIKKLLKKIEEKDAELKKKVEELNKEKDESNEDKKKIEDLLQEAIVDKDSEDAKVVTDQRQDSGVSAPVTTNLSIEETVREETKSEEEEETVKPITSVEPIYRAVEQNPVVSEMYSRLDATYRSIPATITTQNRVSAQAQLYHSLADLREQLQQESDKYGEGEAQIAPRQSNSGYSEEVSRNPHSASQMFERLVERAHQMSEGRDKFNYMSRTEHVISELRNDFNDIIYKQKEEREE